jgi:glutamyl-tRNA synthetase
MSLKSRFAPSPTGYLHIGNLRTFIFAWLSCKKNKDNQFFLRIDDTDHERSKKEYEDQIKNDLLKFEMEWNEEFRQSDRLNRYEEVKEQLIRNGHIYECYETVEELEMLRKIHRPFIYDRKKALELTQEKKEELRENGIKPYWRFKLNKEQEISWDDEVKGVLNFNPKQLSDPVIIRADGSFTYLLISVIDDIDYEINYIVRGEDHVSNTASQIQMWKALNSNIPKFAHIPLLKMPEGKISKRVGGFEVFNLLNEGILPISLINYLLKLGNSNYKNEIFLTIEELIENFNIKNYNNASPNFTRKELDDINMRIILTKDDQEVLKFLENQLNIKIDEQLWKILKKNIENFDDLKYWIERFKENKFNLSDIEITEKEKRIAKIAKNYLPNDDWSNATWVNWIQNILDNNSEFLKKELFMTLRFIITGKKSGPEMSEIIFYLGKNKIEKILDLF